MVFKTFNIINILTILAFFLMDALGEEIKEFRKNEKSINWIKKENEKIYRDDIKWQKIDEKKSKDLKKIIWKSYKDDKSFFEKKYIKDSAKKNINTFVEAESLVVLGSKILHLFLIMEFQILLFFLLIYLVLMMTYII